MREMFGCYLPRKYAPGPAEHLVTRQRASLCDLDYMGEHRIDGPDVLRMMASEMTMIATAMTPTCSPREEWDRGGDGEGPSEACNTCRTRRAEKCMGAPEVVVRRRQPRWHCCAAVETDYPLGEAAGRSAEAGGIQAGGGQPVCTRSRRISSTWAGSLMTAMSFMGLRQRQQISGPFL